MSTTLDFKVLAKALNKQFISMVNTGLFIVDVDGTAAAEELLEESEGTVLTEEQKAAKGAARAELKAKREDSLLWKTYLASFPPGTDPLFRTQTEHNCSCCRRFMKKIGNLVTLKNGQVITVWDMQIDGPYKIVADKMAMLVRAKVDERGLRNEFFHKEKTVGALYNTAKFGAGTPVVTFHHFNVTLPDEIVRVGRALGSTRNEVRSGYTTFGMALKEFSVADLDTVLDLIAERKLDCGAQFKPQIEGFRTVKAEYDAVRGGERAKDLFVWERRRKTHGSVTHFRGSVVGSLFQDLAKGMDLLEAVNRFGRKMDPRNYKQPDGIASKTQIENAKNEIVERGLMSALERQYATLDDIPVKHALHVSRSVKKQLNIFDELKQGVAENVKSFDRAEEMEVDKFVDDVLPRAASVEVFVENAHVPNLVSVIGPADPSAKVMFKYGNPFCAVYNGDLADSVKEKVKAAGGKVDGDLRISLEWWNNDDLDLHVKQPDGSKISYDGWRAPGECPKSKGQLDVDMNVGAPHPGRKPVENVTWPDKSKLIPGEYLVYVHNFTKRESVDVGFAVEMEFLGRIWRFEHPKAVGNKNNVEVMRFRYSALKGVEIISSLDSTTKDAKGREVWGITTQTFRKADLVMWSPNYWDAEKGNGNKHLLFLLEGCKREGTARGFLNEFLIEELDKHRHALQMVGAKMRTETSDRQLSGVGFSTARRGGEPFKVLVRVGGSVQRTIRVVI